MAVVLATTSEGKLSSTRLVVVTVLASQLSSSWSEFGVKAAEKIMTFCRKPSVFFPLRSKQ